MKSFELTMDDGFFKCFGKGDVLQSHNMGKILVVTVYDKVWWVKALRLFRIPTKPRNTIKVAPLL